MQDPRTRKGWQNLSSWATAYIEFLEKALQDRVGASSPVEDFEAFLESLKMEDSETSKMEESDSQLSPKDPIESTDALYGLREDKENEEAEEAEDTEIAFFMDDEEGLDAEEWAALLEEAEEKLQAAQTELEVTKEALDFTQRKVESLQEVDDAQEQMVLAQDEAKEAQKKLASYQEKLQAAHQEVGNLRQMVETQHNEKQYLASVLEEEMEGDFKGLPMKDLVESIQQFFRMFEAWQEEFRKIWTTIHTFHASRPELDPLNQDLSPSNQLEIIFREMPTAFRKSACIKCMGAGKVQIQGYQPTVCDVCFGTGTILVTTG